jgi:hypothetical protein
VDALLRAGADADALVHADGLGRSLAVPLTAAQLAHRRHERGDDR